MQVQERLHVHQHRAALVFRQGLGQVLPLGPRGSLHLHLNIFGREYFLCLAREKKALA